MKYAPITERLANLGGAKWEVYNHARILKNQGHDIIDLTIGEPDVPAPANLIEATIQSLNAGRTRYSNGRGEDNLRNALAQKYTARCGRAISPAQFLCLPGTQTALYVAMMGLVSDGDEVLVGDPMYATYEGVIAATGARAVPVPLRAENGFRLAADDIAARITAKTRVIFLNTPHNPTGSILTANDIDAIGALARKHDLWILSDEVYEDLIFDNATFQSPLDRDDLQDRVISVSSISKSHAAPGFRSGWCVGPANFVDRVLPVAETMLFGNQPFLADATAQVLSRPSEVAIGMRQRFAQRANTVQRRLDGSFGMHVQKPDAGMFLLLNIASLTPDDSEFAMDLLTKTGVAVMPGTSFGQGLQGWIRMALTVEDTLMDTACDRLLAHAALVKPETSAAYV
ncbi:pyridoxal phosphate-dependent aminotransferase [Aestuariibius sp. HNIBRBA575]|uniref:pyridoxal phosphate-dependent aminotransferase n=1 Tax=Aestuariibius sp. HNIBRBA575 TaxID=3233343 RepID=UPI0034A3C175